MPGNTIQALPVLTFCARPRALGQEDLARRRREDPEKLEIAMRLRAETTMTWAWIARRPGMGPPRSLRQLPPAAEVMSMQN